MYARVVSVQIRADKIEEATNIYQAIGPQLKQQPGFVGA